MQGLNKAYLIGNLGQDPEVRDPTATAVAHVRLSIATPSAKKVGDAWIETPDWHRVTAFGKDAEHLAKRAHKGDAIALECHIKPSKWTDEHGRVHNDVGLIVDRVLWLGAKPA